jgi:putrescine transport system substrate-binding protein
VAGKSGYDIVVPTAQWARLQIDGKLLRKLDKSKLPNLKNLDPEIQAKLASIDPGNEYLVDWLWGYTTVGINVNKVKAALGGMPMPDNAWELIFNPKYAAKLKSCGVSFLDSPSEVLPAALMYAGKPAYSKNAADYAEAGKVLQAIRPYVTCSARRATSMTWPTARCAWRWAGRATSTSRASAPSMPRTAM